MLTIDEGGVKGRLTYMAGPIAKLAHQSRARVKYLWGVVGSAKTTWLCWRVYFMAKRAAAAGVSLRAVLVRDTYRNLVDTTLKTFLEWFPDGVMGELKGDPATFHLYTPDGRKHEVMFRHGQTAAEASNFLSLEAGFIGLDEVAPAFTPSGIVSPGISADVFNIAIQRLRQSGIDEPELAMSSNPPPMQYWTSKRIIDADPAKLRELNWAHYWVGQDENKHNLRTGYYEELAKSLPDDLKKRFVDGERVAIYPGLPIFQKDFSERMHVREGLKPIAGLPIVLCVDSSGLAPAALFTQIDHKGRWLWLREIQGGYVDGKLSEQIGAQRFAAMVRYVANEHFSGFSFAPGWGDPYRLDTKSDTDEKSWAQYFRAEGFDLRPGETLITDRIESVRTRLTTIIEGNPALLINKAGCPLAIEALSGGYRWGLDPLASRITGAEPVKDHFSHVMDAAGHGCGKIFGKVKRLIPKATPRVSPPSAMSA